MNFEVLRLAGSLAVASAVMLTASAAMAGDWKKGRGHHKHHHHHYYDREVIVVKPARPVYYRAAPGRGLSGARLRPAGRLRAGLWSGLRTGLSARRQPQHRRQRSAVTRP